MTTLLWLDDNRDPHYNTSFEGEIVWVKSSPEFNKWIEDNGLPDKVSFDYSLGSLAYDGISCVKSLLRYCEDKELSFPRYSIHSTHAEVYKLREYIKKSIYHYDLGNAIEEDRIPDTEDQIAVNNRRNKDTYNTEGVVFKRPINHIPIIKIKISRNEMCPCGSGKKYKRCCLK